jgi:hypothetical protein
MDRILDGVRQFALDFSKNAFFRSLAYGIIFSVIMTLVIGGIVGVFQLSTSFPYFEVKQQAYAYWVGIVFVSFSFLFAFFGYVSDLKAREDILSPLRKKLVGYWEVRAQSWKIENGEVEFNSTVSFCTIGIEDIGRKLIMHFQIRNSDIFTDQEIDVTHITLAYQGEPRQLIYFHEPELSLKVTLGEGADQLTQIKFPFLGILQIKVQNDGVKRMEGRWYDVDNAIYNLARRIPDLKGFQVLSQAVEKGAVTFKGALTFERLPEPPGGK